MSAFLMATNAEGQLIILNFLVEMLMSRKHLLRHHKNGDFLTFLLHLLAVIILTKERLPLTRTNMICDGHYFSVFQKHPHSFQLGIEIEDHPHIC